MMTMDNTITNRIFSNFVINTDALKPLFPTPTMLHKMYGIQKLNRLNLN